MLCEDDFRKDNLCSDIEFYYKWAGKLAKKGKKMLYSTKKPELSKYRSNVAEDYWLWLHLVARDNVYVYLNDTYMEEMKEQFIYDYPLGNPLSEPIREGKIWKRQYQRGMIIFDTSTGKISEIKFEPKHTFTEQ